jgi:hypothetical protein
MHSGWGYGTLRPLNFFARPNSTRPERSRRVPFPQPVLPAPTLSGTVADRRFRPCRKGLSNSHGIISFADPHLLNPFTPYRYKNHRGQGGLSRSSSSPPSTFNRSRIPTRSERSRPCRRAQPKSTRHSPLTPLSATLTNMPISVDSKKLTEKLNPLDATLTKNHGEGGIAHRYIVTSLHQSFAHTRRLDQTQSLQKC